MEKLEPLYIASGNAKYYVHCGKQLVVVHKVKHRINKLSCNSTPMYICKRFPSRYSSAKAHVHGSIIHNIQKIETFQMSMNRSMKKQIVYICNEILFRHKQEYRTDTLYNVDEPPNHCAQWKKSKDHILFHLYEKPKLEKSLETEDSIFLRCEFFLSCVRFNESQSKFQKNFSRNWQADTKIYREVKK